MLEGERRSDQEIDLNDAIWLHPKCQESRTTYPKTMPFAFVLKPKNKSHVSVELL